MIVQIHVKTDDFRFLWLKQVPRLRPVRPLCQVPAGFLRQGTAVPGDKDRLHAGNRRGT